MNQDGTHPLIVDRFQTDQSYPGYIWIDWSYHSDEPRAEFYCYDGPFTDKELESLRDWLIHFIKPEPGHYGEFVFDGKESWAYSHEHTEEDYE